MALQWVRGYLIFEGALPDAALSDEFESLFSPRERTLIFAVFKLMLFFNMLMNTIAGDKVAAGDACAIRPAAPDCSASSTSADQQNHQE